MNTPNRHPKTRIAMLAALLATPAAFADTATNTMTNIIKLKTLPIPLLLATPMK